MKASSRFLGGEQPGFVPDLPLQLANPFFESPLERRKLEKREGSIPRVNLRSTFLSPDNIQSLS
jgi:hypothetical protein